MLNSADIKKIASLNITETATDLLGTEPSTELVAATLREMLIRINTVCTITGLSVQTLYRLMSCGRFPRPVKITSHARAWRLSEIMDWIDSCERIGTEASSLQEGSK